MANEDSASDAGSGERISIEKAGHPVTVSLEGTVIASSEDALVLRETGHEPVFYIPKERVEDGFLRDSDHRTTCPHKGEARYWSATAGGHAANDSVWAYDEPKPAVEAIAGHVAFDRTQFHIKTT